MTILFETDCKTRQDGIRTDSRAAANSTYPKGGVSCSKNSFVEKQTLVFQIKFCGKSPAFRVAANRYTQKNNLTGNSHYGAKD